jgi:gliding motility-associated lipoprotein GldD
LKEAAYGCGQPFWAVAFGGLYWAGLLNSLAGKGYLWEISSTMSRIVLPPLGKVGMVLMLWAGVAACSSAPDYTPKPKGYNRIDLPPHRYRTLGAGHPYSFEYSQYAKVLRDSSYLAQPDWLNIYYPQLHANVQITYTNVVRDRKLYNKMMEDARKLTGKHQIKATSIEEKILRTPNGMRASVFELEGEVSVLHHR